MPFADSVYLYSAPYISFAAKRDVRAVQNVRCVIPATETAVSIFDAIVYLLFTLTSFSVTCWCRLLTMSFRDCMLAAAFTGLLATFPPLYVVTFAVAGTL